MRVPHEVYKGIEFVRISNLPAEERESLLKTIEREKIIKILRDKELLNDCVQVTDYQAWVRQRQAQATEIQEVTVALKTEALKLAYK